MCIVYAILWSFMERRPVIPELELWTSLMETTIVMLIDLFLLKHMKPVAYVANLFNPCTILKTRI